MHKRNGGYILLALLVLTGLASQVYNPTITQKERTFLHSDLKSTKKEFLSAISGLSDKQRSFKPDSETWSVAECIFHLAISEEKIWQMAESALKQPAMAEKRTLIKITDEELIRMAKDRSKKGKAPEVLQPSSQNKWETTGQAINSFRKNRTKLLKYVKTTTHDMRNHVVEQMGMDSYQVLLLISAHTDRHTQQIREVMAHPKFPKN